MDAKTRFEATRKAIPRLKEIKWLIMTDGEDWRPEGVRSATDTSDPTASRAIYAVDELGEKLDALRREERELESLIGESLEIIEKTKDGFGEIYGYMLEWRYIDRETWTEIHEEHGITRDRGRYLLDVAFDWIDSVGVSRLLRGQTDV